MKKRRLLCGVAAIGVLCGSADAAADIGRQADGPHQAARQAQVEVAWPRTLWDRSGTVINDDAGRLCINWLPQHRNDDFLISLRTLLEYGVTIDVDAQRYVMSDLDGGNLLRFVRILQGVNSDVDTNWVRDVVAIDWLLEAYLLGEDEALGELQRYAPEGNENINPHAANILGLLNSTQLTRATGQLIRANNNHALQYFNAAAERGLAQAVINRVVLEGIREVAHQQDLEQDPDYCAIMRLFNQENDVEAGYQSWRLFERRVQVEADNKQLQQESLEKRQMHEKHPLASYDYIDLIMHMGGAAIGRKATILRNIATIASKRGHKDASNSLADMWQDGLGGLEDGARAGELRNVAVNQTPLFDARRMNFLRQANEYYYHQHPLDQAIGLELSPWMLSSLREDGRQRINRLWPDLRRQLLYTEADLAPRINDLDVRNQILDHNARALVDRWRVRLDVRRAEEAAAEREQQQRAEQELAQAAEREVRAAEERQRAEWERRARELIEAAGGAPGNDLIPEIAIGNEEEYLRFLKGKLVYKPNKNNDTGKVELQIAALANPLDSEFNIGRCGDSDRYLSISTGFRTAVNQANENKLEVWIVPQFVLQKDARAAAFNEFLQTSERYRDKPFAVLFNWGGWRDLGWHGVTGVDGNEFDNLRDVMHRSWEYVLLLDHRSHHLYVACSHPCFLGKFLYNND